MKFNILNRWSGEVQVTAEIDCGEDASLSIKRGLAARLAAKEKADLSGANLFGANLSWSNLSGADLSGANLFGANLSWSNLSGADLSGADLSRAYLSRTDLSGADLRDADLRGANLFGADLSRANLSGANLFGAYLRRTDLSGADLRDADLRGANLFGADLFGANLSGAKISDTSGNSITIKRQPIILDGGRYRVILWDDHMACGCQIHSYADWRGFSDAQIIEMDGTNALALWKQWKEPLLAMAAADGRGVVQSGETQS